MTSDIAAILAISAIAVLTSIAAFIGQSKNERFLKGSKGALTHRFP